MNVCIQCGKELPDDAFYSDPRKESGLKAVCKSCLRERRKKYKQKHQKEISESNKRYYEANRERINQRTRKWRKDNHEKIMEQQRIRRQEASALINQFKTPCVKCGEARPWVIHFHHIDPSKKVFELTTDNVSHKKEAIANEEAAKCACLCANCHTEFHYLYGKNPAEPVIAFKEYMGGKTDDTIT